VSQLERCTNGNLWLVLLSVVGLVPGARFGGPSNGVRATTGSSAAGIRDGRLSEILPICMDAESDPMSSLLLVSGHPGSGFQGKVSRAVANDDGIAAGFVFRLYEPFGSVGHADFGG